MGGDTLSVLNSTDDDNDISASEISTLWDENESVESDDGNFRAWCKTEDFECTNNVLTQLLKNYGDLKDRVENLEVAKSKVLSYTPGSWVENIGGTTLSDYNVPKTTTLLLVGPKLSGKSSLVNRISRVFEDDKFAPERAQLTYKLSIQDGPSFLQEYMIPRNSTSFCFYDTPGFSNNLSENLDMIKQWMTKGVCHGELVKSALDSSSGRKCKTRQDKLPTYERRRVGFVIFVLNAVSVLKYMEEGAPDTQNLHMVDQIFNSPFLSFKDRKPVIAITHGDRLSIDERVRVRIYLGDLLGVHPSKQTFDIPDNCDPTTELTIVDMVRYALEHADRNLPCKSRPTISKGSTWTHLLLLLAVGIFMFTAHQYGFRSLKLKAASVPEPSLDIKKAMEFDQEIIPKPDLELKKVTQLDQEADMEIKKVNPGCIPKPSKKAKNKKMKKAEIDWKTIRHIW